MASSSSKWGQIYFLEYICPEDSRPDSIHAAAARGEQRGGAGHQPQSARDGYRLRGGEALQIERDAGVLGLVAKVHDAHFQLVGAGARRDQ